MIDISGFLNYIPSLPFYYLTHSASSITCLISGNRGGKSAAAVEDFMLRLFRIHPVPHKNFKDNMPCTTVRFLSETLPEKIEEYQSTKNTQYPELMKRLPRELIVKDITARRPVVVIQDPYSDQKINVEFASYSQEVQAMAGVERLYIWIDEIPPYGVFEENYARLISTGGDMLITLTPVSGDADWIYDMVYERARYIYRTKPIVDCYASLGQDKPHYEYHPENPDITVIHFATDDNPFLKQLWQKEQPDIPYNEFITSRFYMLDDQDSIHIRRYGLFKYISGRVFKEFSPQIHVINFNLFFPEGIPHDWRHFRSIDYHESNDWACIWGALSPTNEVFIYDELKISPQTNTTYDICYKIAEKSKDYRYIADLIDPRAQIQSVSTATSPVRDMNQFFYKLKLAGYCTGANWRSFDTTTTRGRDEIRRRLKGSIICRTPFNNTNQNFHIKEPVPTIWISSTCKYTIESLRNWSYETWKDKSVLMVKDMKEKPMQKYSHFCTALEGAMKEPMLTKPYAPSILTKPRIPNYGYFQPAYA